jgi:predicted GNAT superfamily acetyltransferase
VVEYARDMYGDNPMSRTDSVIGSDRFVVAWDLPAAAALPPGGHGRSEQGGRTGRSKRAVEKGGHGRSRAVTGGQPPNRSTAQPLIATESDPLPDAPSLLVAIPPDVQALKLTDPEAALRWRRSTRRAFEHYLGRGYTVTGVGPHPEGRGSCYAVERSS